MTSKEAAGVAAEMARILSGCDTVEEAEGRVAAWWAGYVKEADRQTRQAWKAEPYLDGAVLYRRTDDDRGPR